MKPTRKATSIQIGLAITLLAAFRFLCGPEPDTPLTWERRSTDQVFDGYRVETARDPIQAAISPRSNGVRPPDDIGRRDAHPSDRLLPFKTTDLSAGDTRLPSAESVVVRPSQGGRPNWIKPPKTELSFTKKGETRAKPREAPERNRFLPKTDKSEESDRRDSANAPSDDEMENTDSFSKAEGIGSAYDNSRRDDFSSFGRNREVRESGTACQPTITSTTIDLNSWDALNPNGGAGLDSCFDAATSEDSLRATRTLEPGSLSDRIQTRNPSLNDLERNPSLSWDSTPAGSEGSSTMSPDTPDNVRLRPQTAAPTSPDGW